MTVLASLYVLVILAAVAAAHLLLVRASHRWSVNAILHLVYGDRDKFGKLMSHKPWYVRYSWWLRRHGMV